MDITQKANPILVCLLGISRKYKKDYCFPSQETIIKLMKQFRLVDKSRATLNRWLRVIEDGKYLMRRRRIKKDPKYGIIFKSTLYKITIKGFYLLKSFGVDVQKEIDAYEKWMDDKRPTSKRKGENRIIEKVKDLNGHIEKIRKLVKKSIGSMLWNL